MPIDTNIDSHYSWGTHLMAKYIEVGVEYCTVDSRLFNIFFSNSAKTIYDFSSFFQQINFYFRAFSVITLTQLWERISSSLIYNIKGV
jgi:hypothetical protein